jgi:hypothetical protein
MRTDYNSLLPQGVLIFNLKEIEAHGIIKIDMLKKLVLKKQIEFIKIGRKVHIARSELIRYLESRTVRAIY